MRAPVYASENELKVAKLTADLTSHNRQIIALMQKVQDLKAELAAANERAEKAINPPQVCIPDPTDTDPDVHQGTACVEWHEGKVTHIFSAEDGQVTYLKLEGDKDPVGVKWTDPAIAARDAEIERLTEIESWWEWVREADKYKAKSEAGKAARKEQDDAN